jgi:hypothetical protein
VKKIIYFLMVSCAVLALQVATVSAQAPVNMAPPTGAPGAPGGTPPAEPDLDKMTDAELEAMFAEAPEDDAAAAPAPPGGPAGAPPMGAPPMGAPPMGAPPAR